MSRRRFREEKSKFAGTKQVLQNLNQSAHAIVHDADVSLPGGAGGTGYAVFWSSNTWMRTGDISPPIFVPATGEIALAYATLPAPAIGDFSVDVYLNGVSIFAAGAGPKVLAGAMLSADATPTTTAITARDMLEVEILDAGGNYGRAMVTIVVL